MNRQGKRIGLAWLLLSVFVSMLLLSSLHRHETMASADVECMECVHHVHHSGHLTTMVGHLDDCLLCQFLSFVYTAAVTMLLLPLVIFVQNRRYFLNCRMKSRGSSVLFTRGPPSVL